MNVQCQSCGAFAGGEAPTAPCEGCSALICSRCKTHHTFGCEEVQRRLRLGQGPTVRVILEPPVEVPAETPTLTVAQSVDEVVPPAIELSAQWAPRLELPAAIPFPEADVLVDVANILSVPATLDDDVLEIPVIAPPPNAPEELGSGLTTEAAESASEPQV